MNEGIKFKDFKDKYNLEFENKYKKQIEKLTELKLIDLDDEGQIFYYNSNLHYITNYREPSSSTAKINMLVPISENEFLSVENDQIIGYYKY